MLFLLITSCFTIQLKGNWVGTFTGSKGEEIDFTMKVKGSNGDYNGYIRNRIKHIMIPKRIIIEEMIPNDSYAIYVGVNPIQKFVHFHFNESAPMNSIIASTISEDGQFDVHITFSGEQQMEFLLYRRGMGEWYKYSLFVRGHELLQRPLMIVFYILMGIVSILFAMWIIRTLFRIHPKKIKTK